MDNHAYPRCATVTKMPYLVFAPGPWLQRRGRGAMGIVEIVYEDKSEPRRTFYVRNLQNKIEALAYADELFIVNRASGVDLTLQYAIQTRSKENKRG